MFLIDLRNFWISNKFNWFFRKEVEHYQEKNKELVDRNNNLNSELSKLQQEIVTIHNAHYKEKQNLHNALALEKKHRLLSEEECRYKIRVMCFIASKIPIHPFSF